ncbi:MAG: RNA-binding S4 domain-containing protein [Saprospirales bacterium]|nr:RNA-binding S4 domain-containing protein [Saprospirales bacterium]MBK8492494.1 RNA-binding S4 domain-containing protein [Saprospirales bacterium]
MSDKIRVDKWLWAVRVFKSRTLASEACKSGKVKVGEVTAKPSQTIGIGDLLEVKKNGFNLQFKVLNLIEKRVGAPIAVTCYEDLTPAEELHKYKDWFVGKSVGEMRERGAGRPTKRERREIDDFKEWRYTEE